jgi:YbgC/YbaW family acyl-CoA thioester hydrolase
VITFRRAVKFEDVDVARVVFFARFLAYAHEAMEHFFHDADGHYAGMVMDRGLGFPAVRAEVTYHAPLRYGDVVDIETTTARLGNRSATLRYRFRRQDGVLAAEVLHTVVVSDLGPMKSRTMPEDVRRVLLAHLEPGAETSA